MVGGFPIELETILASLLHHIALLFLYLVQIRHFKKRGISLADWTYFFYDQFLKWIFFGMTLSASGGIESIILYTLGYIFTKIQGMMKRWCEKSAFIDSQF